MKNIAEAILKVTDGIRWLEKDSIVGTGNNSYKWVSEKMVKTAVKKLMIENWLSIMPISVEAETRIDRWEEDDTYGRKEPPYPKKTKQSVFTEVSTRYLLLHTSWESIELAWYWQGVDTQDKGAGKATTYALKNTLMNTFMMITWEDTDDTHSDDIQIPRSAKVYKNPYTKKQFVELAEAFNTWWRELALWTYSDQAKDFEITKSIEEKVKQLSETFKQNQQIDDIDSIWKDAEATRKEALWQ